MSNCGLLYMCSLQVFIVLDSDRHSCSSVLIHTRLFQWKQSLIQ